MSLYPFLYVCIIPFLFIILVVRKNKAKMCWLDSVLPILNWILLVYAVYQLRVIIGLIQLFRTISASAPNNFQWQDYFDLTTIRLIASVVFPFLFLFAFFNKSKWFSLAMMLLYLNSVEWPAYSLWEWFKNMAVVFSWFAFLAGGSWLRLQLFYNRKYV